MNRFAALSRTHRVIAAIVCCALIAHATALGGTFVYDDFHSVRDNPAIRSLANIPSFFWDLDAFSGASARMYRPVLLSTLAIDHAIGGGSPLAFKITDLLIHASCALMVFAVARRLRAGFWASAGAGVLFAVHPLGAEAVNYVSSRSDQLLALGVLLAVRSHVAVIAGRRGLGWMTAFATLVACGAKETGVVIPAVLVAVEATHAVRGRIEVGAIARRIAPSVAVAVGYLITRRLLFGVATVAMPRLTGGADVTAGSGRDLFTQLSTMGFVLPRFVAQSFVPVGLSADPMVPLAASPTDPLVWIGWLSVGCLTVVGLARPRRASAAFVGTCIAWAIALPWVVIPLNSPANEHRFYGALAGLMIATAVVFPRILPSRRSMSRASIAAVVVWFACGALGRGWLFRDPRYLWQDTLVGNPASAAALRGLAQTHQDDAKAAFDGGEDARGYREVNAAIDFAYRALALQPNNAEVLQGLIRYFLALGPEHGRPLLGVVHADTLVERRPRDPFARLQKSRILAQAGVATGETRFFDEADVVAMSVLEIAEPKGLVYRVAAEARVAQGEYELALARLDESIDAGLDHRSVRLDRAEVLLRLGRAAECLEIVRRTLAEAPFERQAIDLLERASAVPPR